MVYCGWKLEADSDNLEPAALPAANHQEDLNQQSYYELEDWEAVTRAVMSHGRVPKHVFDTALARVPSYIVNLAVR
jgi:hypothetical protein